MYHRFTIGTLVPRLGLGASCGPALQMQCDTVTSVTGLRTTRRRLAELEALRVEPRRYVQVWNAPPLRWTLSGARDVLADVTVMQVQNNTCSR